MNRSDLQQLARLRLREAKALLSQSCFDGAYYLAGYAVECALKACIARNTKRFDFPDLRTVRDSHSHNLEQLLRIAGLEHVLREAAKVDPQLAVNWAVAKDWSENSRYLRHGQREAFDLYRAVASRKSGVLAWIRSHW